MSARDGDLDRDRAPLLAKALSLSYFSVVWGLVAGAWAISAGLLAGSLGVLGLGQHPRRCGWFDRSRLADPGRAERPA